jgi:hypothetical protein
MAGETMLVNTVGNGVLSKRWRESGKRAHRDMSGATMGVENGDKKLERPRGGAVGCKALVKHWSNTRA